MCGGMSALIPSQPPGSPAVDKGGRESETTASRGSATATGRSMRVRTIVVSLFLLACGVGLVVYLALIAGVEANAVIKSLVEVDLLSFAILVVLTGLYTLCGAEKWRLIDAVLRSDAKAALSRETTFALTGLGMVVGNLVPLQFGMALTRTLGTYVTRHKPIVRGTLGTFLEQGFDLLPVIVVACVSLSALRFQAPPLAWVSLAFAAVVATAMVSSGLLVRIRVLIRSTERWPAAQGWPRTARWAGDLERSGLLDPQLARRLWTLSSFRFVLLILMAAASSSAANLDVPIGHLAGAMPFAVLAMALSPTPGGLGANELAIASMLNAFGTPFDLATQWAIVNRVLMIAASIVVGVAAVALAFVAGLRRRRVARRASDS
jgi:uncharacterized membrane protein YbhN (UPF0104 family)